MNEIYFSGDIAVWKGDDCIDGFTVIFENLYINSIKEHVGCPEGKEHVGYDIPICFVNAINKRLRTSDWSLDWEGSETSFANIILNDSISNKLPVDLKMKIKELQKILNTEADFCMDLKYNCDLNIKDEIRRSKDEKAINKDILRIYKQIREYIKGLINFHIEISFPKRKIITGKTYSGIEGIWEQKIIIVKIYHLIPSSISDMKHEILNTIVKLPFMIKRKLEGKEWKIDCYRKEIKIKMNLAFNKTKRTSECNSIYLLKYDNLEFIVDEDEGYNLNRLRQVEGDVYYFDAERHIVKKNTTIKEELDFVNTDGAMRLYRSD